MAPARPGHAPLVPRRFFPTLPVVRFPGPVPTPGRGTVTAIHGGRNGAFTRSGGTAARPGLAQGAGDPAPRLLPHGDDLRLRVGVAHQEPGDEPPAAGGQLLHVPLAHGAALPDLGDR